MKKTFCVLLAFLMLLPFCPVNSAVASLSDASLAFDGGGLVTLGRPYTVSLGQAAYCSGNGDDLGIKLTDYRFAGAISPQPEEEWVGFDAAGAVFTVEIVIELASAATGLFSFCADFAAYSTNGIYLPSKVEFLGLDRRRRLHPARRGKAGYAGQRDGQPMLVYHDRTRLAALSENPHHRLGQGVCRRDLRRPPRPAFTDRQSGIRHAGACL